MYLIDGIRVQLMFNLYNRRPIDRYGALSGAFQKESEGWYLALRIVDRRGFFFMAMFQAE
jgi:hypothetical protein